MDLEFFKNTYLMTVSAKEAELRHIIVQMCNISLVHVLRDTVEKQNHTGKFKFLNGTRIL